MRMTVCYCDVCGKEILHDNGYRVIQNAGPGNRDICNECFDKIFEDKGKDGSDGSDATV